MSEIQRHETGPPARRNEGPGELLKLPKEWRKPVAFFSLAYGDVLKSAAGVVTLLRLWIRDDGLTLDDATAILRRLMTPEEVGKVQFAGQLLARLGQLVAASRDDRRRREQLAEDRQRFDRAAHHAAPVGTIADATKGILGRWRKENASPPPKDGEA